MPPSRLRPTTVIFSKAMKRFERAIAQRQQEEAAFDVLMGSRSCLSVTVPIVGFSPVLVSRRDTELNETRLNYQKVKGWWGVPVGHIKDCDRLADRKPVDVGGQCYGWEKLGPQHSQANCYRIARLDNYRH
ncbi:hypothetical protein EHS39_36475 [Ensifer sp. MPMI2T]|nr:hypothetical protein EHS39_36475 [Ensifer sp. MPMI2T]